MIYQCWMGMINWTIDHIITKYSQKLQLISISQPIPQSPAAYHKAPCHVPIYQSMAGPWCHGSSLAARGHPTQNGQTVNPCPVVPVNLLLPYNMHGRNPFGISAKHPFDSDWVLVLYVCLLRCILTQWFGDVYTGHGWFRQWLGTC